MEIFSESLGSEAGILVSPVDSSHRDIEKPTFDVFCLVELDKFLSNSRVDGETIAIFDVTVMYNSRFSIFNWVQVRRETYHMWFMSGCIICI